MRSLRQALALTDVSVRTIPQRWSSSIVAVVGVAGVVVVLVAVLSIAEGFKAAMTAAGRPDRAIVMRSGADSEMSSGLTGPQVDIIKQAPGIVHNGAAAGRVGRDVRHRRSQPPRHRHAGQRAAARRRSARPGRAPRREDHPRPHVHFRHERGGRR